MKFFQTITNHSAAAKAITTFGIIFFFTLVGQSQTLNCPVNIDFNKNYETMPTATIKVNFHFLPINPAKARPDDSTLAHEYTMQDAEFLAGALLAYTNQNFENLQHANDPQFYPIIKPPVPKAKIKLELYDGGLGSIFLYSGPGKTHLNTTTIQSRYGTNKVVDIIITYRVSALNTGSKQTAQIELAQFDQHILTDIFLQEDRARLLCHEVGHVLSLEHSFDCGECNSEINNTIECGGICGCASPSNPSKNMMSYYYQNQVGNNEITPCQWATMFNSMLCYDGRFVEWDCQKKPDPLVISGQVDWTSFRIIDRDVIIPSGSRLGISSEVRFVENCKIQVQSGGRLALNNATLTTFCYGYWAGIENQGGGDVSIDNSTIEHALTAVSNSNNTYFSSTSATFRNNMRDIEYLNKPDGSLHIYTNCTFEINNNYRLMGSDNLIRSRVTMYNSQDIQFQGCTFVNNISNPSQYSWNLDYDFQGIYAVGSAFEVKQNGSTPTTFTNFFAGIRSASLGMLRTVNIVNSTFDRNFAGIISDNTTGLHIQNNQFNVQWNNSFPNYYWYRTGILINTGSMFTIKNNRFDGISAQSGQYTFGALVVGTGESENTIESNKFSNLYVGIRALQKNTNSSIADPMGLHIKCSNFKDNFYDYTVEQDGYADGGIRNMQGAEGEGDGNLFSKNGSPVDIWSDAVNNLFSRHYQDLTPPKSFASVNDPNLVIQVPPLLGQNWPPTCSTIEMWGSDQQNTSIESVLSDSLYATELSDGEIRHWTRLFETADNTLNNSKNQHANLLDGGNQGALLSNIRSRWNRDTALLRSNLLAQSPNLSTTVLLDVVQLGTLRKQALMQILLANPSSCREPKFLKKLKQDYATTFSDNDLQTLRNAPRSNSNRFRLENSININNSQRAEAAKILVHHYLVHSDSRNVRKQELRRWLENLGSRHAQYSLAETFIAESESNRYTAQLRNLSRDLAYSASYTQENEDYVELYGIKSHILKSGRSLRQLNPNEIQNIRRIANNTKGDAAVQANNILCVAIGECKKLEIARLPMALTETQNTIHQNATVIRTPEDVSVLVHPNPTSGSLTINFDSQKAFTEGSMSLIDLTGKVVLQQKIDKHQKQIIWQTENIERGLYFILLRIDNRIVSQTKVSVQK